MLQRPVHWQRVLSVFSLYSGGSGSGVSEVSHFLCNGDTLSEGLSDAAVVATGPRQRNPTVDCSARPGGTFRGVAFTDCSCAAGDMPWCNIAETRRLGGVTPFSSNTSADAGSFCDAVAVAATAAVAAATAPFSSENAPWRQRRTVA